jgi:transposase
VLKETLTKHLFSDEFIFIKSYSFKRGFAWELAKKDRKGEPCPRCGLLATAKSGRCLVTVKEEPLRERPLYLRIHKHRYMCRVCRKPFTETAPGVYPKRRTTQRFRKAIGDACMNFVSLQRVRQKYRCSSSLIYNVFYEQLEIKLREKKNKQWPEVVCVDEHFFSRRKGYTEYVTMFADLKKRSLYEVALGKDKKALWEQLEKIAGRENVKCVVMDMSSTYKSFVKEFFPRAEIVADKFHVLRLLSPSIIKHRREIHGHRKDLWIRRRLLMNRKKLDYFVRSEVDFYLKQHGSLNELYRFKEKLHELYRTKGFDRAHRGYERLLEQMKTSPLEEVQRLRRTLVSWKNEVLNYFKTGYTNGLVEAFNNTGKLVQKQAYGYKSFKNYRLRLLSACF